MFKLPGIQFLSHCHNRKTITIHIQGLMEWFYPFRKQEASY